MKRIALFGIAIIPVTLASYYVVHALPVKSADNLMVANAVVSKDDTTANVSRDIVKDLNDIIEKYPSLSIAASLTDLENNQTYNIGAVDTTFKGASTIKVLTAVYYLHRVEVGQASLTHQIDGVSARTLLQRMLQNSDNDAWATIIVYLGSGNIQSYAQSIGLTSFYGYDYNTIKASDYVKLLVKLYDGELITADHRAALYSFMQNTDNDTLIPAALPSDATVYHKWGDLWGNLHDIAIVQYEGRSYALVIFTNNTDDTQALYSTQVAAIKEISRTAIEDFEN